MLLFYSIFSMMRNSKIFLNVIIIMANLKYRLCIIGCLSVLKLVLAPTKCNYQKAKILVLLIGI